MSNSVFRRFFDALGLGVPPNPPDEPSRGRWRPDAAAVARIRTLAAALRVVVPAEWPAPKATGHAGPYRVVLDQSPWAECYQRTIERLSTTLPPDEFRMAMAEWRFFPAESTTPAPLELRADWSAEGDWTTGMVVDKWLRDQPDDYAVALAVGRLEYILEHPFDNDERAGDDVRGAHAWFYFEPRVGSCLRFLCDVRTLASARSAILDFVAGRWDAPLEVPRGIYVEGQGGDYPLDTRYRVFAPAWSDSIEACLDTLHVERGLDYDTFVAFVHRFPAALRGLARLADPGREALSATDSTIGAHLQRLMWQCAEDPEGHLLYLDKLPEPREAKYLVKACEHASRLGMTKPIRGFEHDPIRSFVLALSRLEECSPDDDAAQVVAQLRGQPHAVVRTLLPHSGAGQAWMLEALGCQGAEPLRILMLRIASERFERYDGGDIPNCGDPASGVVDRDEIIAAVEAAGPRIARAVLEAYRGVAGFTTKVDHTVQLIHACMGWNRDRIEKAVPKHSQIALKALGLLPIVGGEDDVRRRYLTLHDSARSARQFGPQRRANIQAAVEAGLVNLARTAGYGDALRLEWAMQTLLAEAVSETHVWSSGEYDIALEGSREARLVVSKAGKRLKTVPATLRKTDPFREAAAARDRCRATVKRFRAGLERMMVQADTVGAEELVNASRVPGAAAIVGAVVLVTDTLALAMLDGGSLRTLDGEPITSATVRVAHPVDFPSASVLEAWQCELVRRGVRQPFMQVFRELYRLSVDDHATWPDATRFAGHAVDARVAARLFEARGWSVGSGEPPRKVFGGARVVATFGFTRLGHYLAEEECLTTAAVRFTRPGVVSGGFEAPPIAIEDVPPQAFSEVMRDVDLVVSAAALPEGAPPPSRERLEQRVRLLQALFRGEDRIHADGHFLRVAGSSGTYRVHVFSAVAHAEPAGHVHAISPARRHASRRFPFLEEFDSSAARVVDVADALLNM